MTKYAIGDRVVYEDKIFTVLAMKHGDVVLDNGQSLWLCYEPEVKPYVEPLKRPEVPYLVNHLEDCRTCDDLMDGIIKCLDYLYERLDKGETK